FAELRLRTHPLPQVVLTNRIHPLPQVVLTLAPPALNSMQFSFDPNLRDIAFKVEDGERLTFDEGLALYNSADLNALGKLADTVRRRRHGFPTYYKTKRHLH